jgi:hypothetical protein
MRGLRGELEIAIGRADVARAGSKFGHAGSVSTAAFSAAPIVAFGRSSVPADIRNGADFDAYRTSLPRCG